MARANTHRYEVKGILTSTSPLLIGGGSSPGMDVTPLQDGLRRFVIPGTSLAGVLRRELPQVVDDESNEIGQIFGDNDPKDGGASALTVFDAICLDRYPRLSFRDGVGIDRVSGTAAEHIKFDQLVLDPGTRFSFEMRVEWQEGSETTNITTAIDHLVSELTVGNIRLGRGSTRALGRVRLDEAQTRMIDLRKRSHIIALSLSPQADIPEAPWNVFSASERVSAKSRCRIIIDWTPTTPVMSAESLANAGVDIVPRTTLRREGNNHNLHCVLPGTSIKGVIRSACEYIVRTLRNDSAPADFLEQLDYAPITGLFGTTDRRSSISVDDVVSKPFMSSSKSSLLGSWEKVIAERGQDKTRLLSVRKGLEDLRSSSNSAHNPAVTFIPTPHVALNRWTSAPVDGALYSVLEIHNLEWEPIVIEIDLSRLPEPWNESSLSALVLILLDRMAAGEVPLGFGGNRGLGSYDINKVTVDARGLPLLRAIVEKFNQGGSSSFLALPDDAQRQQLSDALKKVIAFNSEKVTL